ncbi:HNH endonuclease [Ruania suaedae]|uniref:HNH endonuclease n=1 Tax=Ruania suaedae TaxID=2897774 RepID=UPI001E2E340E|nr:HNH endonuclease signature motif containing protein [Ruania suaedae]UFU03172.1 HNH endonuclease [Ruania suaedae]
MRTTNHVDTRPVDAVRDVLRERLAETDAPGTLAVVTALLDDVLGMDLHALPSAVLPEVVDGVEQARRRLDALTATTMTAAEADGSWAVSGARTMASWWAGTTGGHGGRARTQVHLARTLRDHLPATSAAWAAGTITGDHAAALARHATTSPVLRERLTDDEIGEKFLLEHAARLDADSFIRLVKTWAVRADPHAADRNWREDSDKEHLFRSATTGGYRIDGWLDHASGQIVDRAFDAVTGVPAADDDRTPSQRNAHALVALARYALDSGGFQPGARVRPHLLVHVSGDTLHQLVTTPPRAEAADPTTPRIPAGLDHDRLAGAEPATLADGTPISHAQLATLACDAEFTRIVFGSDNQPLNVGRAARLHTAAQTKAIWARDRHCQFPSCTAPPGWGEIHHPTWWSRGGSTSTTNGVLLCWHHHQVVHQRELTLTRHRDHWHVARPGGHPVTSHHPPPCERLVAARE